MKDGQWGCGGQALALLSNHYSSSFSSCTDRSSISRLLVLASPLVAHEYFAVHTYTHSTMQCIPQSRHSPPLPLWGGRGSMLPAPCVICHTAAFSLMSLSGFSSSFFLVASHPLFSWVFLSFNSANMTKCFALLPLTPSGFSSLGNDPSSVLWRHSSRCAFAKVLF